MSSHRHPHDSDADTSDRADPADATAEQTLAEIGAKVIEPLPARLRIIMFEALVAARHDEVVEEAIHELMREEAASLATVVAQAKAQGSIDPDLSTDAIVALYQGLGLAMHVVADTAPDEAPLLADDWSALADRLLAALSPRAAS